MFYKSSSKIALHRTLLAWFMRPSCPPPLWLASMPKHDNWSQYFHENMMKEQQKFKFEWCMEGKLSYFIILGRGLLKDFPSQKYMEFGWTCFDIITTIVYRLLRLPSEYSMLYFFGMEGYLVVQYDLGTLVLQKPYITRVAGFNTNSTLDRTSQAHPPKPTASSTARP